MKIFLTHPKKGKLKLTTVFSKCPYCKWGILHHVCRDKCKVCHAKVMRVIYSKAEKGMMRFIRHAERNFWRKTAFTTGGSTSNYGINYWIRTNV